MRGGWIAMGVAALLSLPMMTYAQWVQHDVASGLTGGYGIAAGDMDGDGDMDIVASASGATTQIHWYENTGGGWTDHLVENDFDGKDVVVADLDGDGDLDIAGTAYTPGNVAWWENDNAVFTRHDISVAFPGGYAIATGDINGDGMTDIAATSWSPGTVKWWENTGVGWTEHSVNDAYASGHGISLGDLNNDGFPDVAVSSGSLDNVVWYEGDGGTGWVEHQVASGLDYASAVQIADIDQDGFEDIAAAIYSASDMYCFMNNGDGTFDQTALSTDFSGSWNVCAGEIGHDGDLDVIGGARFDGVRYWEYEDGVFLEQVLAATWGNVRAVYAVDMDSDNDDDVIAINEDLGQIAWWEQPGAGQPDIVELDLIPHNPPVIVPQGGSFLYDVHLVSHLPQTVQGVHVWTDAVMPNSQVFGPVDHVVIAITPATDLFVTNIPQNVPALAPIGVYQWRVNLGLNVQHPQITDSFNFTVTANANATGPAGWFTAGWTEEQFTASGEETSIEPPNEFSVGDAFPNPFNSSTRVSVTLPETEHLRVAIYDNLGRLVTELAGGNYSAGTHEFAWRPDGLASGVYFLRVQAGPEQAIRKLAYMK